MNILKITLIVAAAVVCGCCQTRERDIIDFVETPVTEKLRGHENQEWSHSDSYSLIDRAKDYPRAFLVGDSICNGYKSQVRDILIKNKITTTYWVSSYCVTSPRFLRIFSFYLDEAEYDVIHFNNGLHSFKTSFEDWEKGFRAVIKLIRMKQPRAKIVWCNSTPVARKERTQRVKELNDLARKIIKEEGGIEENDLYALMDKCDHNNLWTDGCHFKPNAITKQAKHVADIIIKQLEQPTGKK